MLYGVDPLRIFIYREGLCRFATQPYEYPTKDNIDNLFIHLTNYAINKKSKTFVQSNDEENDESAHKWSLT